MDNKIPVTSEVAHTHSFEFPGSNVGMMIRLIRNMLDITQEELAEKSGLTAATIGNIEKGGGESGTIKSLQQILSGLEIQVDLKFKKIEKYA